jgi:hypothetical protein
MPYRRPQIEFPDLQILTLYVVLTIVASVQCYYGNIIPAGHTGKVYHNYNNYVIFKNSFIHLLEGKNLYQYFPDEQWDLYKYSPTFAFSFGLLARLPDSIGLVIWNLLNSLPLALGVLKLKHLTPRQKVYSLIFCAPELLNNMQNAQSNGLVAGLLILTFTSLENRKYLASTFFLVFSIFIKIYGGIGLLLFAFYPGKRRLLFYTLIWFLLLGASPLLVTTWDRMTDLYANWASLLHTDQIQSTGLSVMSILKTWFKVNVPNVFVEGIGALLILLQLTQRAKYNVYGFRLLFLCSCLIGVVIFNYKAESATYIIPFCGITLWFFSSPKTTAKKIIFIGSLVLTSVLTSDLVPRAIRQVGDTYCFKAAASLFVFICIFYELFTRKISSESLNQTPRPVVIS